MKDIRPGVASSAPVLLGTAGGALFFTADDGVVGTELWKTDGTAAGTALVRDLQPGSYGSKIEDWRAVGGLLFFRADTYAEGTELWRTDGTFAGTYIPRPAPGVSGNAPLEMGRVGQRLLFSVRDDAAGWEPWASDGTGAGTFLLRDIYPDPSQSSFPNEMTPVGDVLVFSADDGVLGRELWATDGTTAGTRLLKDIAIGWLSSDPYAFVAHAGAVFFGARNAAGNLELWRTDGTSNGTVRLKSLALSVPSQRAAEVMASTPLGLFFSANDGSFGYEPWISDGTSVGTRRLADIYGGADNSSPRDFAAAGKRVFFSALEPSSGRELWVTDGTEAGTRLVADIYPGATGSNPSFIVGFGDAVLFFASDGLAGTELWISDGTAAGTRRVKDVEPGAAGCSPRALVANGGTAYLIARSSEELWRTDGTPAGTTRVVEVSQARELVALGPEVVTTGAVPSGQVLWWLGSGAPVAIASSAYYASRLVPVRSWIFFVGGTGATIGGEPWVSDGTAAGTKSIEPQSVAVRKGPTGFAAVRNVVVFAAQDEDQDTELFAYALADATPPSISASIDGTRGRGEWFVSEVEVRFDVVDAESRVLTSGCEKVRLGDDTPGTTVTCTATSMGGSASRSVEIRIDKTPPAIQCPRDVRVQAGADGYAQPALGAPAVVDALDPAPEITASHPPGTRFALGLTTVMFTARDAAGNTNRCAVLVEVVGDGAVPPGDNGEPRGCGCASSGLALPVAALLASRSRRRDRPGARQ